MKPRNPYACHPLMRKGGAHSKSKSGQRRLAKHQLDDEIDEFFEQYSTKTSNPSDSDKGGNQPPFYFIPFLFI